jgi:hypothetical protein
MTIKAIPSLDEKDKENEDQDSFDDAESLHSEPPSSLFNAQDPQQERDEDQEIHGHFLDSFLFPDEIPDEEADEIDRDHIIENHNERHGTSFLTCSTGPRKRAWRCKRP